ncbi:MAG: transposase [Betaproteobacteria bacterium]|jgi:transposase|nr:transposase [Betaproteobacteria bacterium]
MAARKGPRKVNRYSIEMKRTAVRLSNAPGARVMDVAEALDIHPFMLSRWRKLAWEGLLVATPARKSKSAQASKKAKAPTMVQMSKYAKLKRELELLRKEHEFLKSFDRFRAQLKAKGSPSSRGSGGDSK